MQFLWAPALWLLALVPMVGAAYIWFQTRRRKFALRYASLSIVRPAIDTRSRWRRHIPPVIFLLAVALMLVAFARPVALVRTPRQEGIVILAIDASLSMRTQDMQPNRFEAARTAARTFIVKRAPGAQVGLVTFSGSAAILQMPTDNEENLNTALDLLSLQRSTAIGSGILTSLDAIAISMQGKPAAVNSTTPTPEPTLTPVPPGTFIPAIVILLTDGQNRTGPDPIEAAQTAAQDGVRVFTIGIGSRDPVNVPNPFGGNNNGFQRGFGGGGFQAELDENTLKTIAQTTGGEYFYAADANELGKIYSNLGLNIVLKLEKVELTAYVSAAAAVFLIAALGLSLWWGTFH